MLHPLMFWSSTTTNSYVVLMFALQVIRTTVRMQQLMFRMRSMKCLDTLVTGGLPLVLMLDKDVWSVGHRTRRSAFPGLSSIVLRVNVLTIVVAMFRLSTMLGKSTILVTRNAAISDPHRVVLSLVPADPHPPFQYPSLHLLQWPL